MRKNEKQLQNMADEEKEYELHKCAFEGNVKDIHDLLQTGNYDLAEKDKHGNTPLHLAVMLGHKECIHLLLARNAPVKIKNSQGWSPLSEAISYGDRPLIYLLFRKLKDQSREHMDSRWPFMIKALQSMEDFYMELKWDFQSWVPLVSRILPSDICKIYKKGAAIRLDTTLVDFNDMRWERGDISFLFSGEKKPSHRLTVLDNKLKVFQKVKRDQTQMEIEEEVDLLMSSDIVSAQMSMNEITFSRAQTGWIFKANKEELVGNYNSQFYQLNGFTIVSKKRREHLSEEDLKKNKALMETFTRGGGVASFEPDEEPQFRASLNPPSLEPVTWDEYFNAAAGKPPMISRKVILKESSKSFKATVAMSDEFPLTTEKLLSVLEVIGPFKHFSKLRDFIQMRLPHGFPVKIEIPILPTVSAKITFQKFDFRDDLQEDFFEIPADYGEDKNRFPDL